MSEPTGIQRFDFVAYYPGYVKEDDGDYVLAADHVRVAEAQQRQIDGLLADLNGLRGEWAGPIEEPR